MTTVIRLNENEICHIVENVVRVVLNENETSPSKEDYKNAVANIDNARTVKEYDYYKNIINRYEENDNLYWKLNRLSSEQEKRGLHLDSDYLMTNGKIIHLHSHESVRDLGNEDLSKRKMLDMGNIRLIGKAYHPVMMVELSRKPNEIQKRYLIRMFSTCTRDIYVDITKDGKTVNSVKFDKTKVGADFIIDSIEKFFQKSC